MITKSNMKEDLKKTIFQQTESKMEAKAREPTTNKGIWRIEWNLECFNSRLFYNAVYAASRTSKGKTDSAIDILSWQEINEYRYHQSQK